MIYVNATKYRTLPITKFKRSPSLQWLHHAEAKLSVVVGQHGEKSAGRPEGALTRAARELSCPVQRRQPAENLWSAL